MFNRSCFRKSVPKQGSIMASVQEWYAMARALRHEAPPLPKLAIKQDRTYQRNMFCNPFVLLNGLLFIILRC